MKKITIVICSILFVIAISHSFFNCQSKIRNKNESSSQEISKIKVTKIGEETYPSGTKGGPMILIPVGEFMMGCNRSVDSPCGNADYQCRDGEEPYHKVYLDAYYIDKYEVSVSEYEKCVQEGKCREPSTEEHCNWGINDRGNHPVNCVDWNQANLYCEWAGKRLPTEAEWEKAARGIDGRVYPWGNQTVSCDYAVLSQDGKGCGRLSTWSVGSKPKDISPYGAMDMAGNVSEWVQDWYDEDYYKISPGQNPVGPLSGSYRVVRGGSLNAEYTVLLCAAGRHWLKPVYRGYHIGFRCARVLNAGSK